jgi:hypothetical protein
VRTVNVGSRVVPYWEAGATINPYSRGYFAAESAGASAMMAWMYTTADAGSGPFVGPGDGGGHGGSGLGGGFDGGGFDGGGSDGGGGGD